MRGKFEKKKSGRAGLVAAILLIVLAVAAVMLWPDASDENVVRPHATGPRVTRPGAVTSEPTASIPEQTESPDINLGYGLTITESGKYTGLYMEDGSNELLSDVMMIVVHNGGEQDIQLAEITAVVGDESFRFQLTNLAAGARAVLLDLDRKPSGGAVTSAVLDNAVLFDTPMELCGDTIEVSGMDGMVNVQNISDEDIEGDVYVYYKYAAEDIYYGGITFRVRVQGGLKAGEIRQIPAGHYNAEGCAVVQVTVYG